MQANQRTEYTARPGRRHPRESDERIYHLYLRHFKHGQPERTRVLTPEPSSGHDAQAS
jgi:hypothetical protein